MSAIITDAVTARERLHRIIDEIEDTRVINLYEFLKDENVEENWEYPEELKAQLDKDFEEYQKGAETFGREEVQKEIKARLNSKG